MSGTDLLLSITELSQRTGVNAVTLRAWERRYGLLRPQRSAKGYRLYDSAALVRVQDILAWLDKGVTISRVRAVLESEAVASDAAEDEQVQQALACVDAGNWRRLEQLVDEQLRNYPLTVAAQHYLLPLLGASRQRQMPGAESRHQLLYSLLEQKLQGRLLTNLPSRRQPGLLLLPLGEENAFQALLLAALLRQFRLPAMLARAPVSSADYAVLAADETVSGLVLVASPALSATALAPLLKGSLARVDKPVWLVGEALPAVKDGTLSCLVGPGWQLAPQLAEALQKEQRQ